MDQPVAMVTGAGRGIGRATAVELARAGYRVALAARNQTQLEETAALAGAAIPMSADVTDPDACAKLVGRCIEHFGRLDAIVHCAGGAPATSILQMSPAAWRDAIETNLSSAFYLCHAAWPIFAKQNSGVVVLISSESARDPFDGFAAYGSAKAGLNLFGLTAAREGEAIGVRVHIIAPGAVETQMLRKLLPVEALPADQTLEPADVARVIGQCVCGDLRYASGEVIYLHRRMR